MSFTSRWRFLCDSNLDKTSVAQPMSWVAKRHTTKEEDIAYYVFGILSINMAMIYSEDEKFFGRNKKK